MMDNFTKTMIELAITSLQFALVEKLILKKEEPGPDPDKLQDIAQCFDCHRTFFNVGEMLRKAAANTWFCSKCDNARKPRETGPVNPVE